MYILEQSVTVRALPEFIMGEVGARLEEAMAAVKLCFLSAKLRPRK